MNIQAIYAFGDSFLDVGNDIRLTEGKVPPPPYADGRFADGPVWIDHIAAKAGLDLKPSEAGFNPDADRAVSFAYGGAGTGVSNLTPAQFPVSGVLGQVIGFRDALQSAGRTADPNALYVVWGGSNDYLLNLAGGGPQEVIGNLRSAIEMLVDLGARNFLVPNLPDLGATPIVIEAGLSGFFTGLTDSHNQLLTAMLSDIEGLQPGVDITELDVHALFDAILADPGAFGLTTGAVAGPAAGCLFPPFQCGPVGDADGFFWDEVHPTTAVHEILANAALDILAVPEPSVLLLLGTGILGIGLIARR